MGMQAFIFLPTERCPAQFVMECLDNACGASKLLMVPVWPPAAAGQERGFPVGLAPYRQPRADA